MILKLLLVGSVIAVVYFMFIKKKPLKRRFKKEQNREKINEMIECEECGIYCEVDDAFLSNAKYYCSSQCVSKA